jgi:hypothetical protein
LYRLRKIYVLFTDISQFNKDLAQAFFFFLVKLDGKGFFQLFTGDDPLFNKELAYSFCNTAYG